MTSGARSCAISAAVSTGAAGQGDGGGEAALRATERVRQAALPLYTNLFTPISNQPHGALVFEGPPCTHSACA